jgi:hypothetical protein
MRPHDASSLRASTSSHVTSRPQYGRYILAETFVDLKALYRSDFDIIKATYPDLIIEMHKSAARSSYIESTLVT